jgi:hypothetical protein
MVVPKSDYRTPKSYPKNPRGTHGTYPCLMVDLRENRLSNMISIVLIYLLNLTKDFAKTTVIYT